MLVRKDGSENMSDGVSRTKGAELLGEFLIIPVAGNHQIVIHDE